MNSSSSRLRFFIFTLCPNFRLTRFQVFRKNGCSHPLSVQKYDQNQWEIPFRLENKISFFFLFILIRIGCCSFSFRLNFFFLLFFCVCDKLGYLFVFTVCTQKILIKIHLAITTKDERTTDEIEITLDVVASKRMDAEWDCVSREAKEQPHHLIINLVMILL